MENSAAKKEERFTDMDVVEKYKEIIQEIEQYTAEELESSGINKAMRELNKIINQGKSKPRILIESDIYEEAVRI